MMYCRPKIIRPGAWALGRVAHGVMPNLVSMAPTTSDLRLAQMRPRIRAVARQMERLLHGHGRDAHWHMQAHGGPFWHFDHAGRSTFLVLGCVFASTPTAGGTLFLPPDVAESDATHGPYVGPGIATAPGTIWLMRENVMHTTPPSAAQSDRLLLRWVDIPQHVFPFTLCAPIDIASRDGVVSRERTGAVPPQPTAP